VALIRGLPGTSIQQKDEESSLNIAPPSYNGLRATAKRPTNMSTTVTVMQKPEETPTDFYERLCEAFWVYTPFNLEAPETSKWSIQYLWPSQMLTFTGNFRNFVSLE
jgi:hypothetical protein